MKIVLLWGALPALLLAACSGENAEAPTGQVVATVKGQEITLPELKAEIGPLPASLTPAQVKQVESNALQMMIARHLLADAARERKLDNTPIAAVYKRRAEQGALAELLQGELRKTIPAPTREEAQIYVRDNPQTFSQRSIFLVDQIVARGAPPKVVEAMRPLNTLEEVTALLNANRVPFTNTVGVIDSLTIAPSAARQIGQLQQGAIFVSPEGQITRINRLRETRVSPVAGDEAVQIAQRTLQGQRTNQLLQQQLGQIISTGLKGVQYNDAYKPKTVPAPKPAPGGGGAAPAGNATAPAGNAASQGTPPAR